MVLYGTAGLTRRSQAREVLAFAVKEHWGLSPVPTIEAHSLGKPFFPDHPQLHFNLSHSGPLALCALDEKPIGVDIQLIKPWRPALPERTCCREELEWLARQPDQSMAFALLWSLKEARVKQSGLGLRMPIREISVPLTDGWAGTVSWDGLRFRAYFGDTWAAAVCGLSPAPADILWYTPEKIPPLQSPGSLL